MKTLMMIAAVAAATGAYAGACTYVEDTPETPDLAWVYNWKFTGKTTVGAPVETKGEKAIQSTCSYTDAVNGKQCVIRVPGSLAIQGYTALCNPECLGRANWFREMTGDSLWNGADKWDLFYSTKPAKSWAKVEAPFDFFAANVIGKSGTQFELGGKVAFKLVDFENETFELVFAGLGSYDKKNYRVSSVSGNFAGTAATPIYAYRGVCIPAIVWNCSVTDFLANDTSVAYGSWSVKFNSSASAKLAKNKKPYSKPSWVKVAN